MIRVDNREPREHFDFLQKKFKDREFKYVRLKTGDYISDKVICERKTIPDLYSSIMDRRLYKQLNRMSQYDSCVPLLLVTGDIASYQKYMLSRKKIFVNDKLIYSTIADVSLRYGFEVIWTPTVDDGLCTLVYFMEHVDAGEYRVPTKADKNILAARLLGITVRQWGEVKKIGSLADIAKSRSLTKIKGIGEVKAKKIIETLNTSGWMNGKKGV